MSEKLAIISEIADVCKIARSFVTTFRQIGIIQAWQLDLLLIKIESARRACIIEEAVNLFEHNLDALEKASNLLASKCFHGREAIAADRFYSVLVRELEKNLEDFYKKCNN